jgi:xanthine/uracil permease
MKSNEVNLDVHEMPQISKWVSLSIQHLFAMFGATIVVLNLILPGKESGYGNGLMFEDEDAAVNDH